MHSQSYIALAKFAVFWHRKSHSVLVSLTLHERVDVLLPGALGVHFVVLALDQVLPVRHFNPLSHTHQSGRTVKTTRGH